MACLARLEDMDSRSSACIYVLRLRSGRPYVGATIDLRKRLADHFAGTASRTPALSPPVGLVCQERFDTVVAAPLVLECFLMSAWTGSQSASTVKIVSVEAEVCA